MQLEVLRVKIEITKYCMYFIFIFFCTKDMQV